MHHVPERSDADQNVSFEDLVKWKCWLSIAYGLWIAQNIFWLYFCHGLVHCFSAWEIRTKNLFMCVEHLFIWKYRIEFFSCKVPFILSSLKIQVYLRNLHWGLGCFRPSSGKPSVELLVLVRHTEPMKCLHLPFQLP